MIYQDLGPKNRRRTALDPPEVDPTNADSSVESTLRAQDYNITALSGKKRASVPEVS
jgi:hypothetical protein